MMVAILNSASAMLDSDTLFSSLRFTQKHPHSTLTLTQTNSIWLKLIHSHSTWWWQPSWIHHLRFSHLSFSSQTHSHLPRLVPTICTKKNFTHTSLPNLEFGAHQGPGPPPHPTHLPPWRSTTVISPLSHFCGTTLSVAEEPPGHCTNSLNGKASVDRRSKHAHAHI